MILGTEGYVTKYNIYVYSWALKYCRYETNVTFLLYIFAVYTA